MSMTDGTTDPKTAASIPNGDRHQKMLNLVANLFALAEDAELGDRPEEAELAYERAYQMMAKHRISEAMVRDRRDDGVQVDANATSVTVHLVGDYLTMQAGLLGDLSMAMQCQAVLWRPWNKRVKVQVFGMPDHLRSVRDMWGLLAPQADRALKRAHPGRWASSAEVTTFRRSWVQGYGVTVANRIHKADNVEAEKTPGVLELYKSDSQRAEIAMYDEHPYLKDQEAKVPTRQFDLDGYLQGCRDGETAQLHRSIGG